MNMSIWFFLNASLIVLVITTLHYQLNELPIHILFGLGGFILVLFNWTRHAVFSTIRSSDNRKKKIRLANISKKILPFHRWIGTTALILIIIHAWIIFSEYGFLSSSWKMLSGIVAGIFLLGMVATGWLRFYLPSRRRRWAHIIIGFLLFFLIAIHTLVF